MLFETDNTHLFYCYTKLEVIRIKSKTNLIHVEVALAQKTDFHGESR